ncbi:MAG: lysostaphin resistance A-like protein [Microcystaceae cyanobacterium]
MNVVFKHLVKVESYPVFVRMGLFLACLIVIWLPFAIPIYLAIPNDPNLVTILTMGLLYIKFLILLKIWNQWVIKTPQWLGYYGLTLKRKTGITYLQGLSVGLTFTYALFITEAMLGWIQLQGSPFFLLKIVLEGGLSATAIAFAEEVFFRGWMLTELEKDYPLKLSLWLNAIIFASLHFIKPLSEIKRTFPQFPALVLLGLILVWSKRKKNNNLGLSMGIHGGLVWGYYIFNVGQLVTYSDKIHPWIIGIDRNPLAGIMGLLFLGLLAIWVSRFAPIKN